MTHYRTAKISDQTRLQAGMPKRDKTPRGFPTMGVHVRAVVVATYVYDEPEGANNTTGPQETKGVYCDLLTYGRWTEPIHRALVMQPRGGIHSGNPWIPRPAKKTDDGVGFKKDRASIPAQSDGDHVVVTFMEDNFQQALIIGAIPHPIADVGNQDRNFGHRIRPVASDGEALAVKNRGSFYSFDNDGNFELNTTRAHDGSLEADLSEPDPALSGEGLQRFKLPEGSRFEIAITKGVQKGDGTDLNTQWTRVFVENNKITIFNEGGEALLLVNKNGDTTMKIGDGAKHVALVEDLEAMWTAWQKQIGGWQIQGASGLTFSTIVGPAFQVLAMEAAAPATEPAPWDSSINSSKVSLPDG